MSIQFEIHGLENLQSKLEQLNNPRKVKSAVRKALRQGANIVRDAARANAKAIDDPETKEKIWRNIAVQGGKSKNKNVLVMRIGVKGGASFSNPNPPSETGGDTRHWRWIEFGSVNNPAVPFMRPALSNNIQPATNKVVQILNDEIDKALASAT